MPGSGRPGRRARRWTIVGCRIGLNYLADRAQLITACESSGPGTLIHPTLGSMQVKLDTYSVEESREKGGFCAFSLNFVEAGSLSNFNVANDTQARATSSAQPGAQTTADALDRAMAKLNNSAGLGSANGNIG